MSRADDSLSCKYNPDLVAAEQASGRWSVLARTAVGEIGPAAGSEWDPDLLREARVLVPIDVQALVVEAGDPTVRGIPCPDRSARSAADDPTLFDGPAPFSRARPRPPGVHLHWAMPDALLRGTLRDPRGQPGGGLGLAALPDRFTVLRLASRRCRDRRRPGVAGRRGDRCGPRPGRRFRGTALAGTGGRPSRPPS